MNGPCQTNRVAIKGWPHWDEIISEGAFLFHSSLVDYLAQVIHSKKLSHHLLLHFPIGMGSYDHHAKYQGVFP